MMEYTEPTSPEQIIEQINQALVEDDQLSAGNIWVNVEEGHVTLAGTVKDDASVTRAEELVRELPAVEEVESMLESIESQTEIKPLDETLQTNTPRLPLKEQVAAMTNEGGPPPNMPTPEKG